MWKLTRWSTHISFSIGAIYVGQNQWINCQNEDTSSISNRLGLYKRTISSQTAYGNHDMKPLAYSASSDDSTVQQRIEQLVCLQPSGLREHRTLQPFSSLIAPASIDKIISKPLYLFGTAVRCMLGWCKVPQARAYAYGLYMDDDAIQQLGAIDSEQTDLLSGILDYKCKYNDETTFALAVCIKMARDIDGGHIAKGFENSIRNRLNDATHKLEEFKAKHSTKDIEASEELQKQYKVLSVRSGEYDRENQSMQQLLPQIRELAGQFKHDNLSKGDQIIFVWSKTGKLYTVRENKVNDVVFKSPVLARALFDVYVGPKSVSERGRITFKTNAEHVIHSSQKNTLLSSSKLFDIVQSEHVNRSK